jgi:ferredoxin-NADP reductase
VTDPTRSPWKTATVVGIRPETPRAKSFRLSLPGASGHRAGQHYIVRLTAPDGYTASRSYSVASAPDGSNTIELTVERLEGGEVSTFLHDVVEIGDELEVRGPIGGWFVWDATSPALLVGGGSGVVPLMAMLRLARLRGRTDLLHLVVSVRGPDDLYYADELVGPETTVVYTRTTPPGFPRPAARLAPPDLPRPLVPDATAFVCGSPGFADGATDVLVGVGIDARAIRVERFGPTS